MKRILFFLMFILGSLTMSAQIWYFKTTAYAQSTYSYNKWSNWSSWENSNMNITMNLNTDVITIYSPKTQIYRIYDTTSKGYDSDGDYKVEFKFIDQDGDRGTMWLYQRSSGASEIYIIFSNIRWVYRVKRIS